MHDFQYRGDNLFCEDFPIQTIAKEVGTPFYLYSLNTLEMHFQAFDGAFSKVDHLVCFSAKANSNIAILRVFIRHGGGVDVVSGRTLPGDEGRGPAGSHCLFRCRQASGGD